jgi:outer membrane protein OmpA-like peptidoglycan-associated protein
MTILRTFAFSLLAAAALAACSTMPAPNAMLDQAHQDYQQAVDTPQTAELAPVQLQQAGDTLAQADAAARSHAATAQIDHLAYLARQRVAIAQTSAQQKRAESAVREGEANRDQARLVARTSEADTAKRSAISAQRQAEAAQGRSESALLQAQAATRQADEAQARNSALEAKLKELDARKTDRGLVITLGDVLFDTNQAQLKSGGLRSVEKLSAFLQQYPQRKALVEGFTDSVGGQDMNEALSQRRADAVRSALVGQGVDGGRISTHGYGEAHPVAGNDSAAGRQQNRRVEIVLSDENGQISAR